MCKCGVIAEGIYFPVGKCVQVTECFACKHAAVNSAGHIAVIICPCNCVAEICFFRKAVVDLCSNGSLAEIAVFKIAVLFIGIVTT